MIIVFFIIFWLSILLVISSYFFYPAVLWFIGKVRTFKVKKKVVFPTVSVIIPAYNEEKNIAQKIRNTLELEYPLDRIEILIGSDGSTDRTTTIMRGLVDDKVHFWEYKENRGKTAVQNDLVRESRGEILVFTDAASFLQPDALLNITKNFADKRVGCVAGKMFFVDTDSNLTTESQGIYWTYEAKLRELESGIGSLIGVDGPLYAIKRDFYVPLPHHIISDFLSPLLVLSLGKAVVLEPHAVVYEEPTIRSDQELRTRRRITLRGLTGLFEFPNLLNPFDNPLLAFQIFFHKLLRWFVGPLIIANFFSSIVLASQGYFHFIPYLYAIFIVSAGVGAVLDQKGKKLRILAIPYYFILVNVAATLGIIDFFRKKQVVTWKPVRK